MAYQFWLDPEYWRRWLLSLVNPRNKEALVYDRNDTSLPRGIRNKNPGNVRENQRADFDWMGEARGDWDPEFEEFSKPEYGVRAIVRILQSYRRRDVVSIEQIIATWAPAAENDVKSYINSICAQTGMKKDTAITEQNYVPFIEAVIVHENGAGPLDRGRWYPTSLIEEGIRLATVDY